MLPIINIFGIKIASYGICVFLGIVLGIILALIWCRIHTGRYNIKFDNILDFSLFVLPISIICARLYYVLFSLDYFIETGFTSLIIDLRDNPGGVLSSVEEVADKFIDNGVIVSTRGRKSYYSDAYYASPELTTMPKNIPIVVLINGGSASASEILAGALKDTRTAYLVGNNTYGKGSVQEPRGLPYEDGMKITIAKYYTPSGANIDKIGIPPDEEVNLPGVSQEQQQIYVDLMKVWFSEWTKTDSNDEIIKQTMSPKGEIMKNLKPVLKITEQ